MSTRRAVIITALSVEYKAITAHLNNIVECIHGHGTVYETGDFKALDGSTWQVSVAEIGAGNPSAARETERALTFFSPEVAMLVGVAGGLKDATLGDVVVGTKAAAYGYNESGKANLEFEARPEAPPSTYDLIQRARAEAKREGWLKRVDSKNPDTNFSVFVGPIASGEKVLASRKSALCRFIRSQYGDALAVEMEGWGFLQALHSNHDVQGLIIRGISDLIDRKQASDKIGWQTRAANHAAAFAFEILAKLHPTRVAESSEIAEPSKGSTKDAPQVGGENSATRVEPTTTAKFEPSYFFRFQQDKHIEQLIHHIELGDWDESADAALSIITETLPDGSNPTFDALIRYYDCPSENLRWAALQTVESAVRLSPNIIDQKTIHLLASHEDFSIKASAASICMELANCAPSLVPVDILIRLSQYDGDWYVQAPANAAIKTLVRSMPQLVRIYYDRLKSSERFEREHAASALVDTASAMTHSVNSQGQWNVRCWAYGSDSMCDRQRRRSGTAASD